jgi:hypothetical protein
MVPVFAIFSILLIFFLDSNYNGNFFSAVKENDNSISDNQEIFNDKRNGQDEIDDYSLRGATNSTSGGKRVTEKYLTYLCGASFEKRTDFIQEYMLPFPCSQPVGITPK